MLGLQRGMWWLNLQMTKLEALTGFASTPTTAFLYDILCLPCLFDKTNQYSWPPVSTGSPPEDATAARKYPGKKNFRKFQKAKLEFATSATIYIAFTLLLQLFK